MMMKKILFCFLVVMSLTWHTKTSAQDNLPFTLNSAGDYGNISGGLYDFNFGEMVLVSTFDTGQYLYSQGFLQPYYIGGLNTVSDIFVANNVLTPNGDGKNDVLTFVGLEKYTNNQLSIFNRAGRKIFGAVNYQNDWNGMYKGIVLNEDTYYYVLELGSGIAPIRGFVSVVLDQK